MPVFVTSIIFSPFSTIFNVPIDSTRIPYVSYTLDENSERSKILTPIASYVKENVLKFITGQESMDNWDAFVAQVKESGIDEVISITQTALDRYNNR